MKRLLEIDALRGLAVAMMVIYHIVFDLHYFGRLEGIVPSGEWLVFGRIAAFLFVFLAGVSMHLSLERAKSENRLTFVKYFARGAGIFMLGMIVSLATWIYPGEGFVIFGVLHLIGICIILGYFFERFYVANLVFGIIGIVFGAYANSHVGENLVLFVFGFPLAGLWTLDYFPIFPWMGVFLLGMFFGKTAYPKLKRRVVEFRCENAVCRVFAIIGRHTLLIYFAHQPIILLLFSVFGII